VHKTETRLSLLDCRFSLFVLLFSFLDVTQVPSVNLQPRHEPKSSLNLDSQIHKNHNEQYYGAIEFQGSKPLSKSQPNLAPTIESSTKGRQSVSRTSSSNSDHSSHT
jgi:hypothetical protein